MADLKGNPLEALCIALNDFSTPGAELAAAAGENIQAFTNALLRTRRLVRTTIETDQRSNAYIDFLDFKYVKGVAKLLGIEVYAALNGTNEPDKNRLIAAITNDVMAHLALNAMASNGSYEPTLKEADEKCGINNNHNGGVLVLTEDRKLILLGEANGASPLTEGAWDWTFDPTDAAVEASRRKRMLRMTKLTDMRTTTEPFVQVVKPLRVHDTALVRAIPSDISRGASIHTESRPITRLFTFREGVDADSIFTSMTCGIKAS